MQQINLTNKCREYIGTGVINLQNDTFRMALMLSTVTLSPATDLLAGISAHEHAATSGYTAGGVVMPSPSYAGALWRTNPAVFQPTSAPGFTFRHAVIYRSVSAAGNAVVNPVVGYFQINDTATDFVLSFGGQLVLAHNDNVVNGALAWFEAV